MRHLGEIALLSSVSWLILCALIADAARGDEFGLGDEAFDGVGAALAIFDEAGLHYEALDEVDFSALGPEDAVLLLRVDEVRSARGIIDFIERGGALILAEEGPALDGIYQRFGFERLSDRVSPELALGGFDGVYLAPRYERHPLSEGVDFLVVDRPRPFYHPSLSPIFTLDERQMIVAVGRLGSGELVALGDSSLFINQLARLSENRRFLQNFAEHLADRYARLLIVRGPGIIISTEAPSARGLVGFREALASIRTLEMSALGLYLASIALLLALTLMLGSRLYRGALFQGPERLGYPGEPSGIEWSVEAYGRRGADLSAPIASVRRAVYRALSRRISQPVESAPHAAKALDALGLRSDKSGEDQRFFERLDEFALSSDGGARVEASRRDLLRLLDQAEALIARLEAD